MPNLIPRIEALLENQLTDQVVWQVLFEAKEEIVSLEHENGAAVIRDSFYLRRIAELEEQHKQLVRACKPKDHIITGKQEQIDERGRKLNELQKLPRFRAMKEST